MSSLDGPTVLSLGPTSFTDVPLRPSPSASPFGRSLDTGFMAAAVPVSGVRCCRGHRIVSDDIAAAMRPVAVYPGMPALLLSDASALYGVIDEQNDDRTDHCDEHTVEIKSGNSGSPDHAKDKAANNRSDNPENDIENHTLARFVDYFARDETRYQTQDQPTNDRHDEFSFLRSMQRQPPNTTKILTLAASSDICSQTST